jgi:DNA-binding transcriptional LysR family regulator
MGVYQKGSVSQAAQGLFLSPQACSKILQKLETELNTSLFKRTYYGMEPTAQGDALYRQALALADLLSEVKRDIDAISRRSHVLNIASTQGIKEYLSLAYAKEFSFAYPFITLNIMESTDVVVRERMRSNVVELGILGGPIDLTVFRCIPFTRHRICLVANQRHPLARKGRVGFADIDGQPLALISREFASYHLIINRLLNERVRPDIVTEATELDYCHRLAAENEALAISFDFAAWGNLREGTVVLPFEDPNFFWETFIVYKVGTTLSEQARQFCDFTTAWLGEHADSLFRWPGVLNGTG